VNLVLPTWSTACPDWEQRITDGRSLIPFPPLFPAEAEAALEIFRKLIIVDAPNRPTMEQASREWVFDFVSHIFGSYDAESGRRLIRYFLMLIAKKNSKSTTAAGIMLTALIRNWRDSGEFFILAPTKEVADNSFGPAYDMITADENLTNLLHVKYDQRLITHRNTGATLKVIAADNETVSGKKTIGLLIDELWLFGKKANASSMIREVMGGLASRPEGFVIYLSTQSDKPPAGVFSEKLEEFRDIRDGKVEDRRSLPVIYEFPKAMLKTEAYLKPENFYITNPNIGASVDAEYLLEQLVKAQRAGKAQLADFLAKHLNVQIGQAQRVDGWAGATVWERGIETGLDLDEIIKRSEVITVGIDGGGLDDLLGLGIIGREKGTRRWLGWSHALISDIGIERRKANAEEYDRFEADGDLTKFVYVKPEDHDELDGTLPPNIQFIVDTVMKIRQAKLLAQVGVDAAGIGAIVDALAEKGITQDAELLGAVRQGISLMGAIKTVEIKLADYTFRHGGSRMLSWCVGNAVVRQTSTAMMIARDEAGFGKVDPLMALFNAAVLMALNPKAAGSSVYEKRGLRVA
jgi:phage terminase large subunit-like protein